MDFQWAHTDPLLQSCATPSEEGATAGGKLFQAEGFTQHVIGPRIQQGHHRFRSGTSREHHHRAVELGRQPEGGRFLQELRTDEKVGGLPLTDL
jgi:hypothetical protein